MSTMTALPPNLREKLASVIGRIRRLQILRGLSYLILGMSLAGGLAMLVDYCFDLPAEVRETILGVWFALGAVLVLFGLVIPLARRLDPQALAAAVEAEFPDLREQLTSSVELAGVTDIHHGSAALIALLIAETGTQTSRLNFLKAFPAARSARWSALAGAAVLLILSPALPWPGQYAELGQRFLLPWWQSNGGAPYSFAVSPGDAFAAKGRSLTVSVRLVPEKEGLALPQTCTMVRTDEEGNTTREFMTAEIDGFILKLSSLTGSFQYHVEAGKAISDTYQVTAVEPVQIAAKADFMWEADSPTITITPPAYAQATIPVQRVHELIDLAALQHSRVSFHFRFTRPAAAAYLEFKAQSSKSKAGLPVAGLHPGPNLESNFLKLELSADRREGRIDIPARTHATYQIALEAEHGIRTELEPRKLIVTIDQPPQFAKVTGAEDAKELNPYDHLPLEIALTDDVGVDIAEVEYRINEGASLFEPIPLQGRGKQTSAGKHDFLLAGKVKDGDRISYRIKASDNRRVPEAGLRPQVVYYPPESVPGKPTWKTIKINRRALPRGQQDIVAQRDAINHRLDAIKTDLLKEQRGVYKLRMESRNQPSLEPEQARTLQQLRQDNRGNEKALRELAHEAAEMPAFQPIAERAQQVADQELQHSSQDLQQAEKEAKSEQRDKQLQNTDQDLASALQRLEEMRRESDRMAQAKLDQMKLENLAERQGQLAQQAELHAATEPGKDPKSRDMSPQLQRDEDQLAKELQHQIDKSDILKKALESSWADESQQLAKRARELAKAERELKQAAQETNQKLNKERLADLAKKQQELADKIGQLSDQTRQPAQAAVTRPLKSDQAQKAAKALKEGDAEEAVQRQTQAARELDKLAADFNKAMDQARNPREAAYQILHLQDELRARFAEAKKKSKPSDSQIKEFERDQNNIKNAMDEFAIPADNSQAENERKIAAERTGQARDAFRKDDLPEAALRMAQARQAVDRMAKQLPDQKPGQSQDQKAPVPDSTPGLPSRTEADQARQLAKQQRDLREAVRRVANTPMQANLASKENPIAEVAKRQKEIAKQAEELAQDVAQDQGQKATPTIQAQKTAQTAQQTSDQIQAGALSKASQTGQQTAQQLRQLGRELSQNPGQPQKSKDQAKHAQQLAQNQEELNRRMAPLTDLANAQQLQQQARQEDLSRQTGNLKRDLGQLALQMRQVPQAMQAFMLSQQARAAMEQAQALGQLGNQTEAQQSRQQAAEALDQAAQQAEQAGQQLAARQDQAAPNAQANKQTGQALDQAQGQIKQAQGQLTKGQNQNAQAAMRQAAKSLKQAAQQVAQQMQPGQPNPNSPTGKGADAAGAPDLSNFGKDVQKYAGKSWGELPGELRNKIIQDMTTKYGDDYARLIKLYFEQIADTRKVGSGQ